jgi:DNA repair photolyase
MEPRKPSPSIPGRGAVSNPGNRFERARYAPDEDPQLIFDDDEQSEPGRESNQESKIENPKSKIPLTQYLPDHSHTIIAANNSPDVPFARSINPYRGCSHGCIYCYARPTHEYLGMSAGLDFESKILVKHEAPELLRSELTAKSWQPQKIALSGVTDCYQPIERQFGLTRRCLEVLLEFRNPVGIVTKNRLVVRDLDLLVQMAAFDCVQAFVSLTTLDPHLTQVLEPRTSVPRDRLRAVRELSAAGIPVGVLLAPIIPALNDHEIPALLQAAKEAGARSAAYVPLRLPYVVKDLFADWLERHLPERKEKVLNRIRDLRGGALNDSKQCSRMHGRGVWAEHIGQMFHLHAARLGFDNDEYRLSAAHFRRPPSAPARNEQMRLFQRSPS